MSWAMSSETNAASWLRAPTLPASLPDVIAPGAAGARATGQAAHGLEVPTARAPVEQQHVAGEKRRHTDDARKREQALAAKDKPAQGKRRTQYREDRPGRRTRDEPLHHGGDSVSVRLARFAGLAAEGDSEDHAKDQKRDHHAKDPREAVLVCPRCARSA